MGIKRSTLVSPTLAIIYTYEWNLDAAKGVPGDALADDDDAELAGLMGSMQGSRVNVNPVITHLY